MCGAEVSPLASSHIRNIGPFLTTISLSVSKPLTYWSTDMLIYVYIEIYLHMWRINKCTGWFLDNKMWPKCYTHFTAESKEQTIRVFQNMIHIGKLRLSYMKKWLTIMILMVQYILALMATVVCPNYSVYSGGDNCESTKWAYPSPGLNHAVKVKLLTSSNPLELSILPQDSKDGLKRYAPPASPENKKMKYLILYFVLITCLQQQM